MLSDKLDLFPISNLLWVQDQTFCVQYINTGPLAAIF